MILCNSNRLQTFVTFNLNALIGPKIFKKNYVNLTTLKLNDSENENKRKSDADRKAAKLKLLKGQTKFVSLDDNNAFKKKEIRPEILSEKFRSEKNLNKENTADSSKDDLEEKMAKYIDKENVKKAVEDLRTPIIKFLENEKKAKLELELMKKLEQREKSLKEKPLLKKSEQRFKDSKNKNIKTDDNFDLKEQVELSKKDSIKVVDSSIKEIKSMKIPEIFKDPASRFAIFNKGIKSGKGLSIFSDLNQPAIKTDQSLTLASPIWETHDNTVFKLLYESSPLNGFDEMIKLTDEGKLWKFPIDNEQEIDETEANISFDQHIFLDSYLEKFPQIEPIQQFMTLVLNGISLNSYLTLNEKKEMIEWYRNYFDNKLDVIKQAMDDEKREEEFFKK